MINLILAGYCGEDVKDVLFDPGLPLAIRVTTMSSVM